MGTFEYLNGKIDKHDLWAWAWPVQPLTNFSDLKLFLGVSWVHDVPIPGAKHFEFKGGSKANFFGGSDLSFGHHRCP